jgi:hypothetical protein
VRRYIRRCASRPPKMRHAFFQRYILTLEMPDLFGAENISQPLTSALNARLGARAVGEACGRRSPSVDDAVSARVLPRDARELAGQQTGRLLGNRTPNIQTLIDQTAESNFWHWLRPLNLLFSGPEVLRSAPSEAIRTTAYTRDAYATARSFSFS